MWGEDRIDFIYEIVENSYFLFIIPLSCSKETKPVIRRQIRFFFLLQDLSEHFKEQRVFLSNE